MSLWADAAAEEAAAFDGWLIKQQASPAFLAVVRGAMAVVSRHLGKPGLERLLPHGGATVGLFAFLPIVDMARLLIELEQHDSLAPEYLRDLRAGKFAETLPVLRVAAGLSRARIPFEVEPPILSSGRLRRPDFRVDVASREVCVEVTCPDVSDEQTRIQSLMNRVANRISPVNLSRSIGVLVHRQLSETEQELLIDHCRQLVAGKVSGNATPGAHVITLDAPERVQDALRQLTPGPALFSATAMIGADPPAQLVLRAPFTDERVQRVLGDKRRHGQLSRETPNLLVLDLSRVPFLLPRRKEAVQTFLSHHKNRRISAVLLTNTVNWMDRLEVKFHLIRHPNPYLPLPAEIEEAVTAYLEDSGVYPDRLE